MFNENIVTRKEKTVVKGKNRWALEFQILLDTQSVPFGMPVLIILLTKITAAQNEVVLSYHRAHKLNFLAVVFAGTIIKISSN